MGEHINSERERIEIARAGPGRFEGMPPMGSGVAAPMLLDEGTRSWLAARLQDLDASHDQDGPDDREDGQ